MREPGAPRLASSNFNGVSWHAKKRRWQTRYRQTHLGYFASETAAAEAFDDKVRRGYVKEVADGTVSVENRGGAHGWYMMGRGKGKNRVLLNYPTDEEICAKSLFDREIVKGASLRAAAKRVAKAAATAETEGGSEKRRRGPGKKHPSLRAGGASGPGAGGREPQLPASGVNGGGAGASGGMGSLADDDDAGWARVGAEQVASSEHLDLGLDLEAPAAQVGPFITFCPQILFGLSLGADDRLMKLEHRARCSS